MTSASAKRRSNFDREYFRAGFRLTALAVLRESWQSATHNGMLVPAKADGTFSWTNV
jgi:hypothetical protein